MLPGIAGASSALLYLDSHHTFLNRTGPRAWVFGSVLAVLAWLLLAPLVRRYAFPSRSIPSVYDDLRAEYDELKSRFDLLGQSDTGGAAGAKTYLSVAASELGLDGRPELPALRWTLASGYVGSWKRLHRVREELLTELPVDEVVEVAMEYRSRLKGSKIANADGFARELELAILGLAPDLAPYLDAERPSPVTPSAPATDTPSTQPPADSSTAASPTATSGPADEGSNERLVVRRIMRTIHEYRDSRRAGLVRSRNRLFATVLFAGTTAYAVLGLALVVRTETRFVAAGIAYYLLGGVIGLFQQLRAASAADTVTEEDYGLSTARLIHTPLFSGIAAVAGVALAVLAPVAAPSSGQTTTSTTTTPARTTTSPTRGQTGTPVSLKRVFDIENYPAGVVVAAVFGLTPSLLITRLQRQAEQYKADLRGSEAGESHGGAPESSA